MLKNQLLSAKTYELIKDDIVTCVLEPGQQLAQSDLVARYRVGMTPVREALRQLAHEGFIHAVPRLGYIVSLLTIEDVQEIFELRSVLESGAAILAAERGPAERLREIRKSANFAYKYKNRQSYSEFLSQNKRFHMAIAQATQNTRLTEQVGRVFDELTRVFHLALDLRDSAAEMREDHIALAEALINRRSDLARQLVEREISRSQQRVVEALAKYSRRPLGAKAPRELARPRSRTA